MNYKNILSKENPVVKSVYALRMEKERRRTGLFIIEGSRLVRDALKSSVKIKHTFIDINFKDGELLKALQESCEDIYTVSAAVMRHLTDVETSQGVLCAAYMPNAEFTLGMPRTVALESVRDPGNLGAILRSAEAFGFACILSGDCCDPFSPKVVRASMGSVFRIPIFICVSFIQELTRLKESGYKLYAAMLNKESVSVKEIKKAITSDDMMLVVIGNEARGISPQTAELCTHIHIPMRGGAESLNASVAAAIILWEVSY